MIKTFVFSLSALHYFCKEYSFCVAFCVSFAFTSHRKVVFIWRESYSPTSMFVLELFFPGAMLKNALHCTVGRFMNLFSLYNSIRCNILQYRYACYTVDSDKQMRKVFKKETKNNNQNVKIVRGVKFII